jgi:hypoxanthine phosphoribosyltransferase
MASETELSIDGKQFELFIDRKLIHAKISELALDINRCYAQQNPDILVVMEGAEMFAQTLFPLLKFEFTVHRVSIKTYQGMHSQREASLDDRFITEMHSPEILILEDIIETGNSLVKILGLMKTKTRTRIRIACLLSKPDCLQHVVQQDFTGFEIGPEFVIGFGMDYNEEGRQLEDIYRCISS